MNKFNKIFSQSNNVIIGAIHFPPLLGYPDFPGFGIALKNALADLKAFEDGGADAVIIENNYDIPHKSPVDTEVITSLAYLGDRIKSSAKIPVGISVLWNDYRTALSLAKVFGLEFIRVPVFVDKVKTSYGIFDGNPDDVIAFRKHIGAEDIAILTDIHVKHSEILSTNTIEESARLAIEKGSDALIVTGRWTGDAPEISNLEKVRKVVGSFQILCGSGVDKDNVDRMFKIANGAIVSTSVKSGIANGNEINVKSYSSRIDVNKVKELTDKIKGRDH